MRFLFFWFVVFFLLINFSSKAQTVEEKRKAYIERWSDEAIHQMYLYKVPASITLAQGILETGGGQSWLAETANNHFGIKCHDWIGDSVHYDDDVLGECFRKYDSPEQSYKDHSIFLATRKWYKELFTLDMYDYRAWAYGLKKAGYATNPKYPQILISLIERYNLYIYDYRKDPEHLISRDKKACTLAEKENRRIKIAERGKKLKREEKEGFSSEAFYHPVLMHENKIKYVKAREGDSLYRIAQEFGISTCQLFKYNDLDKYHILSKDEVVFIEPKKKRFYKKSRCKVRFGDTVYSISQEYGVKLKSLLKFNDGLREDTLLSVGEILILQK